MDIWHGGSAGNSLLGTGGNMQGMNLNVTVLLRCSGSIYSCPGKNSVGVLRNRLSLLICQVSEIYDGGDSVAKTVSPICHLRGSINTVLQQFLTQAKGDREN